MYASVTVCTSIAAVFDLIKTMPSSLQAGLHLEPVLALGRSVLPWFDLNLGWVVPALIGLAIGLIIRRTRKAG